MFKNYAYNIKIALEAMALNKLRSMLTSLGIICGVGSVIAMLAIGEGAQSEILEKMKILGTNNIILTSIDLNDKDNQTTDEDEEDTSKESKKNFSPGLTLADMTNIREYLPTVTMVSPEIVIERTALREGKKRNIKLIGITNDYFVINGAKLSYGSEFHSTNFAFSEQVCIIGSGIRAKLFPTDNPLGKQIKVGDKWLKVIAVMSERNVSAENLESLGLRDFNYDIYIPINTLLLRYRNRSLVTKEDLQRRRNETLPGNQNQLDKITIRIDNSENMSVCAEILDRMLIRRHREIKDYKIIVPELLLKQEQDTKRIFNIVLGAIASISLIVGGIGIMNIMLASVMERTKEIGIRLAVGATQRDVLIQFLSEAVAISLTGGIIGIISGVAGSYIIESTADINTIITPMSVFLSFFVSISVGLIFGILPAKKAASQKPIDLLRYQ